MITCKEALFFTWAVRDGDVAATPTPVPESATMLLMGMGFLAGIIGAHRRKIS